MTISQTKTMKPNTHQQELKELFDQKFRIEDPESDNDYIDGVWNWITTVYDKRVREEVMNEILTEFAGEMMKARVQFELNEGDGTGKDEMPIEYYRALINKFGDVIKSHLSHLSLESKEEK